MGRTRYELFEQQETTTGRNWAARGSEGELWKAIVSGLAAGAIATVVMTQYQTRSQQLIKKLQKRQPGQQQQEQQGGQQQNPTVMVANRISKAIAGREISKEKQELAGLAVHYGFGALMGGLYGLLNHVLPAASAGRGLAYGTALWASADEIALPASGMAKWWPEYPIHVHANALGAHLVYAFALDAARRGFRQLLDTLPHSIERAQAVVQQAQETVAELRPVRIHRRGATAAPRVQRYSRFAAA
ncbi:MAG: DUF1440 domain-containing protein [Terriglobales bacterium]